MTETTHSDILKLLSSADEAYASGSPIMSDSEYDALRAQVESDKVGAAPGTVEHAFRPMLSLDKCTTKAGFLAWRQTGQRLTAQYKIDGVACSLLYGKDGKLIRAATRGDGRFGEDITRHVAHLPQDIPAGPVTEVRGELYMPLSTFNAKYAATFANPRNLVAGILGSKGLDARAADIEFFAYDVFTHTETPTFQSLRAGLNWLVEETDITTDWMDWSDANTFEWALDRLPNEDFEADGVVFSIDDRVAFAEAGFTSHHPRGAIAWKFPPEEKTSVIEDVIWQTARTGKITPVAIVRPVVLSGARVTKATLHNLERFLSLHVCRGATARMVRRGGVIPHIEQVLPYDGRYIAPPTECPKCSGPVERVGPELLCVSEYCGGQHLRGLVHFAATLEMDGWGPAVVASLVELGALRTIADFWHLDQHREAWENLDGFGQASVDRLLGNVPKVVSLQRYIAALGVPGVGLSVAHKLCSQFGRQQLLAVTADDLVKLPGIGWGIANNIVERLLPALREPAVELVEEAPVAPDGPFTGQLIVFTGELECMRRVPAQRRVQALGGQVGDTVTKKTTLLVCTADEMTTKRQKAEKYGVRVVNEAEFLRTYPQFLGGPK